MLRRPYEYKIFIANQLRMPVLPHLPQTPRRRAPGGVLAGIMLALLTACTQPGPGDVTQDGIFDPYEARNRKVHEGAKRFDRAVLRPLSRSYSDGVPGPAQQMIGNFAGNLSVPGAVVNQVLQFDLEGAARNTIRFGLNSTLGFGGVFDVARDLGIEENDTDFGHTLAVWGVPEGAYLELPLIGPSTERDAFGVVVDLVIDPLNTIPRPEGYYLKAARIAASVGKRGQYSETLDSVLYDSADSYAQTRLLYLQNRRFEVGQSGPDGSGQEPEIDPYAELYGQ